MKKKYKGIIKGIFILFIAIISITNVNASNSCPKKFGEKIEDNGDGTITASVNSGKFIVFVQRLVNQDSKNSILLDANGNATTEIEKVELTPGNSITIRYNKNVSQTISIKLVYSEYTNECYKDNVEIIKAIENRSDYTSIINNKEKSYYITEKSYPINQSVSEPLVYNSNYNGICAYLRSGSWPDKSDAKIYKAMSDNINKSQYEKYYRQINVSECRETLPYQVSLETTAKSISAALKTYVASLKPNIIVPAAPSGIKKEFNLSTKKGLADFNDGIEEKCSAIFPDGYKKTKEYNYTNESVYYAVKPETKYLTVNNRTTTCERYCTETLTVRYGPPVATKGGLCFEYRVEVKSTVDCDSKLTPNPPQPSDYEVCTPVAQCSETRASLQDQGGPNENFDACIKECDGGKYSQSCINKCYNRVYANKQKIKLSYTAKAKKVANENDCASILDGSNDAAKVAECIQNGDTDAYGKYSYTTDSKGNPVIYWEQGKYYWTQYARYYFSNQEIAQRTIRDDINYGKIGTWYNPDGAFHLYQPDSRGFKTSAGIRYDGKTEIGETTWCNDECKYVGCDPTTQKLNKSDVDGSYDADLEKYNNFVNACNAGASCSETTANFTIEVNNKTKDNNENWITYNKAELNQSNLSDPDNIVLNRDSECYGENTSGYKYLTEWSFPGTWINVKTGKISYTAKPSSSWTKYDKKFCTNLKSANVNEAWWQYGVTKDKTYLPSEEVLKNIEWNIRAKAENFGQFEWNINVQCFYALKDTCDDCNCDCNDPTCKDPKCSTNQTSKKTIAYHVRSVDNADLFPQASNKSTTSSASAGRTPGFNWTYAARNLKNSNYIIAPDLLISKIQDQGDNIYADDKNIDYEFYLDRKALATIRAYSKANDDNYTKFGGKTEVINGVLVYKSDLFREDGKKLDSNYARKVGIVGCNNQENDSCYNFSQFVSGIGG